MPFPPTTRTSVASTRRRRPRPVPPSTDYDLDHIATSHRHRGLAALSAYLQAIPDGDGIRTDLKRDLEQRLTEVTTEWIKDQKVEETIEKLDEFVVRVSRERRNSEIDPEWADRLIETAQQALALLTTGDTGDD